MTNLNIKNIAFKGINCQPLTCQPIKYQPLTSKVKGHDKGGFVGFKKQPAKNCTFDRLA